MVSIPFINGNGVNEMQIYKENVKNWIKVQVAKKLKDKRQKRTMEEIFKKVTSLKAELIFLIQTFTSVDWINTEIIFPLQES